MRLFLDTNAFLWWRSGSSRLSRRVVGEIQVPQNEIGVSIASLWEIAIKRPIGKLRFDEDFEQVMADEGFELVPIAYRHLRTLGALPLHHRDPFDRILIAQALTEDAPIASSDRTLLAYGVRIIW